MKKQTVQLLQRLLVISLFVLFLKIIIDFIGSKTQDTQTLHKKLNNINSRIQKLKNDRLLPTTTMPSVKKKEIENKLRQAQYEKNHYLSILRNKNKEYSNHDYKSLESRLQARIDNNKFKKLDNMAKKVNELHAASNKTRPPTRPPTHPLHTPTRPTPSIK